MARCKYYKKMKTKGYIRCNRDGSIRKSCYCPYYKLSLWGKLLEWLGW